MNHLNKRLTRSLHRSDRRGFVAVTVALLLSALLAFAALSLDISTILMIRGELQNAADAGALAGAGDLYLDTGLAINPGANAVALAAATANSAQNNAVEVNADTANNTGDVERGHWRWSDRSFTASDSLTTVALSGVSDAALDANNNFINAVRVRVHRQATPAVSFFAGLLGFSNLQMQAEAIGYIGFAGTVQPVEVDQPIALCSESLRNGNAYSCSTGRMIDSSQGATNNTAGWTNFTQEPCLTASSQSVAPYVGCVPTPNVELKVGVDMGTTGGQLQSRWDDLYDCWEVAADSDGDGKPDTIYSMYLPVIDCPSNNVLPCSNMSGVAKVNMVWMVRQAHNNHNWIPIQMSGSGSFPDWSCPDTITGNPPVGDPAFDFNDLSLNQKKDCWAHFVDWYQLVNWEDDPITSLTPPMSKLNKTMFFLPTCDITTPTGVTGGRNFGVLARIPVLVQ